MAAMRGRRFWRNQLFFPLCCVQSVVASGDARRRGQDDAHYVLTLWLSVSAGGGAAPHASKLHFVDLAGEGEGGME